MKKFYFFLFILFLAQVVNAQTKTNIIGADTACISSEERYSVEVSSFENNYLFRDSSQNLSAHLALDAGYTRWDIQDTFTYDLWVKPTRTITMKGESSV